MINRPWIALFAFLVFVFSRQDREAPIIGYREVVASRSLRMHVGLLFSQIAMCLSPCHLIPDKNNFSDGITFLYRARIVNLPIIFFSRYVMNSSLPASFMH